MRRTKDPYNGEQFAVNMHTGEVHNLDRERSTCYINKIKPEYIYNCASYLAAQTHYKKVKHHECNGCIHCMLEKHIG